jgi:asparagine synthase (glutamine-hydrolysing)
MCGLSGVWDPGRSFSTAALTASLATIHHRGPDDEGLHVRSSVAMGMRRLAIIDVDGGQQPIYNEDGTVAVVFNGEIYNYRELVPELERNGHRFRSQSDTEVLVHLYEEHGAAMVEHLRGMFAFAIADHRRESLFLARDRFGKKPLFYRHIPSGGIYFASELKALKQLGKGLSDSWELSEEGIYDFLSLGVVPQPATVYRGIYALPAGSWLRHQDGQSRIEQYWSPTFSPSYSVSYQQALDETRELIRESVSIRLRSDVPLGVFLSGGMDSSVVAYEAANVVGANLQTFTVSVDDKALDESGVARRTAQALHVKNTVLPLKVSPLEELQHMVRHYDQPYADSSAIPSLAISRLAREHVKVVLNGDGGDEVFGGYRRHVAAHLQQRVSWVPRSVARTVADVLSPVTGARRSVIGLMGRFARGLAYEPAERYLVWTTDMLREADKRAIWKGSPQRPTEDRIAQEIRSDVGSLDRQLYADIRLNLLSDLLVKMDMATSAASLEGRSPLLDHVLADYVLRLPPGQRLRGNRPKALLRDAYRGILPDEVIEGKKRGFEIPLVSWLENDLQSILMDTVGAANARVHAFVDRGWVTQLLEKRVMQDRNWGYIVFALLVLELWLRDQES